MNKNVKKTAWFKGLDDVDKTKMEQLVIDKRMLNDRDSILKSSVGSINQIFQKQLRTVADIRNIFKTLPQLNFPRKILVSSILSPGDITKNELVVKSNLKLSDYNLISQFNRMVQEFTDNELEVTKKVSRWLDDALILEGSHPVMILPSSVVNAVMGIVSSNESSNLEVSSSSYEKQGLFSPMGLLGIRSGAQGEMTSLENSSVHTHNHVKYQPHTITSKTKDKIVDLMVTLTDNPSILTLPIINSAKLSARNSNIYGTASLESMIRYPDKDGKPPKFMPSDIRKEFFKSTNSKFERVIALPTPREFEDKVNSGHPLEYHLPADSVIPISTPGEPENHSHYIVILDDSGYPVSYGRKMDYYSDIRGAVNTTSGSDVAGDLLHMAADNLGVTYKEYTDEAIDQMATLHSTLVETEVTRSIMAGADGAKVAVNFTEGLSKLMLARTLRNQRTILLYVPSDYITYFAFDYDEIGVGKSILEDSKSMAAMLSTLTVANVIGSVENAIPGKNLEIKLDPKDRDPLGTATFLTKEAMDLNYRRFPMGLNSTAGTAEELQMNAYSVSVTGHPAFPEVETSVSAKQNTFQPIETDLMDKINDYMFLLFSVPAELAGATSNQPELATTVVANNLMLLKTVIEKQSIFNPLLSDYLRKYIRYSGVMVSRLFTLADANKKDIPKEYKGNTVDFIEDYISNLSLNLPSPETDNLSHQMQLFDNFAGSLDKILDVYLNEESLLLEGYKPEIVSTVLAPMREAYKHHCLRQYMRERAIMSDLDIFRADDEDNPTINLNDELKLHSKYVIKSVSNFIKSMASTLSPHVTELKQTIKQDIKAKEIATELNEGGSEEEEEVQDGDNDSVTDDMGEQDEDALPTDDLDPEAELSDEEATEEDGGEETEVTEDDDEATDDLESDNLNTDEI